jgi:hypothetical protein
VLPVEQELLGPNHDVVGGERDLKSYCVRGEAVERELSGAGPPERLDAVLDLGVLMVGGLKRGDVWIVLVSDAVLEAMPACV